MIVFLPLLGALLLMAFPREEKGLLRHTTMAFMTLTFFISLGLLGYDGSYFNIDAPFVGEAFPTMQFVERYGWIQSLGASYLVGVDGISLWLVMLTTFLGPLVVLSTYKAVEHRVKEFMIMLLVLQTGMLGALVALDGLLFYVFWEMMLIPMYFLIGIWGGKERHYAAMKFFIYTMVGSLLMLVALLYVYFGTGGDAASYSFALSELFKVELTGTEQTWLFAAFALAFAIKVPLFPLHTWLPDAHVQAPTAGSVILAGVLLKMGTYGLIRYGMPLFPEAVTTFAPLLGGLAVVGVVYGALVAMVQKDVKKLVAYSSVSHLGFCVLGLMALTPMAVEGSLYVMLAHGVATGGLFLCVGVIYERLHTRDIAELGGISAVAPRFAAMFMIIVFMSAGVPGLAGFVGEFLVILGTSQSQVLHLGTPQLWFTGPSGPLALEGFALVMASISALGMIFGAVYLLWMFQRVMFGPVKGKATEMTDLTGRELAYLVPLVILGVLMGLFPETLFMNKMHRSVDHFLESHMRPGVEAKVTAEQQQARLTGSLLREPSAPPAGGAQADDGGAKPQGDGATLRPKAGTLIKDRVKNIPKQPLRLNAEQLKRLRERIQQRKNDEGGDGATP